jgi:hypothetical protein
MRKEYSQALRKIFSRRMKEELPQFSETKVSSMYFWPGDRAYGWSVTDKLRCWIVLSPSKKDYDEFNILVGWSKLGRYPELSMVRCAEHPSPERREFKHDEYLTRLPYLWTDHDVWWVVKEFRPAQSVADLKVSLEPVSAAEAHHHVQPRVEDAIRKLNEYGIPYLKELCHAFNR